MWTVETQYLSAERKAVTGNCIIYGQGGEYIATVPDKVAGLIVEAPAMAEALRRILQWINAGCDPSRKSLENARAILSRIDGAGDTLPDAPAVTANCPHCGRDNTGHEGEPCADDCPQYWEEKGKVHPEHPTGELVTVRADHLAALVEAAGKYADDLETGLEDGTYEDRADLDAVQAAIAAVQGEKAPTGDASTCQHCGEERPLGPDGSVWTCGACNGLNCD